MRPDSRLAPVMLMLLRLLLPSQVYNVGGLEASSWGSAAPLTLGSTITCRQKKSVERVAETSVVLLACSTSVQSQKETNKRHHSKLCKQRAAHQHSTTINL